jgi:hypothetical protein
MKIGNSDVFTLKGENFCVRELAMQSNCNGLLIIVKQAKKNYGSRRQEAMQEFKIFSSPVQEKGEAHNSVKPETFLCRTDPYIWFISWHHLWEIGLQ